MGVTKARLIEAGALVVAASWRVTPDKYEGPREFDDYVKALRYSEETCGRYELLVGLLNPDDTRLDPERTPLDSGDELPRGSVVVDRGFRIDNWRFGESFKTPDEAYLSVPDGKCCSRSSGSVRRAASGSGWRDRSSTSSEAASRLGATYPVWPGRDTKGEK
jgi:hypothetical protein